MTENTNRANWGLDEHAAHQRDLDARRAAWEQEQKQERERKEREAKQAQLEGYLRRRAQAWEHATGTTPPMDVLQRWQEEYTDQQEAAYQQERAAKLAEAEDLFA
jgi:hypothetical protein